MLQALTRESLEDGVDLLRLRRHLPGLQDVPVLSAERDHVICRNQSQGTTSLDLSYSARKVLNNFPLPDRRTASSQTAIRTERHFGNPARVSLEVEHFLASIQILNLYLTITTARKTFNHRRRGFAVRTERHTGDPVRVSLEGEDFLTLLGAQTLIVPSRLPLAIRVPSRTKACTKNQRRVSR